MFSAQEVVLSRPMQRGGNFKPHTVPKCFQSISSSESDIFHLYTGTLAELPV